MQTLRGHIQCSQRSCSSDAHVRACSCSVHAINAPQNHGIAGPDLCVGTNGGYVVESQISRLGICTQIGVVVALPALNYGIRQVASAVSHTSVVTGSTRAGVKGKVPHTSVVVPSGAIDCVKADCRVTTASRVIKHRETNRDVITAGCVVRES